jgi:diguanylate cyclase (GGDEF)-like protein
VQRAPAHVPPQPMPELAPGTLPTVRELHDTRHDRTSLACVDSGDWDALFRAVQHRLRHALAGADDTAPGRPGTAAAQAAVLECVEALEQLHRMLADARRLAGPARAEDAALHALRAELAHSRALERQAYHSARHDDLTELPNRLLLHERLNGRPSERPQATGARSHGAAPQRAVLFVDLDGFKAINDTHGHDIGDALLRIVAARLCHAVRADDMVARLGGDEFVCVLDGIAGREPALALARKVFDAVSAPVTIGTVALTVRPSIGIAMAPDDGHAPDTLLRSADRAMFLAKRFRTGCGFLAPDADAR